MYLKGYRITTVEGKIISLPKWDFGGDKAHTYRAWNLVIRHLRALPIDSYPLQIVDQDVGGRCPVIINSPSQFEDWLANDYDTKDYLRPKFPGS